MRSELNPSHPVTQEMREMWHKIAAILLVKFGHNRVVITLEDTEKMARVLDGGAICVKSNEDNLEVFLVDGKEAVRLAKEEGGLPV